MKVRPHRPIFGGANDRIQAYWSSIDQLEVWDPTTEVPRLATESTAQDWIDAGILFVTSSMLQRCLLMLKLRMFTNKRYEQARVAFLRAGESGYVAVCDAFLLRENARVVPDDRVKDRAHAFGEAGEAFHACANGSPPGRERERLAYYTNAADCFVQAKRFKEAGDCFVGAGQYEKAARAYREGAHFDEMVEVLGGHGDKIEASLVAQLKKVAQMNYFKVSDQSTVRDLITEARYP